MELLLGLEYQNYSHQRDVVRMEIFGNICIYQQGLQGKNVDYFEDWEDCWGLLLKDHYKCFNLICCTDCNATTFLCVDICRLLSELCSLVLNMEDSVT